MDKHISDKNSYSFNDELKKRKTDSGICFNWWFIIAKTRKKSSLRWFITSLFNLINSN